MSFKLVFLSLAVVCLGAPAPPPPESNQPTVIPIVSQSEELEANGTYKFSYETGNGIKREEISYDKVLPPKEKTGKSSSESSESDEIHVQIGSWSYTAPDGTLVTLKYTADENGFRPIGNHIPRSPVVPNSSGEKSARSLDSEGAGSAPAAPKSVAAPASEKPTSSEAPTSDKKSPEAGVLSESTTTQPEATTLESASTDTASSESAPTTKAEEIMSTTISADSASSKAEEIVSSTTSDESVSTTMKPEEKGLSTTLSSMKAEENSTSKATTARETGATDVTPTPTIANESDVTTKGLSSEKPEVPEEPASNTEAATTETATTSAPAN